MASSSDGIGLSTRSAVIGQVVGITPRSKTTPRSLIIVNVGLRDLVAFVSDAAVTVKHGDLVAVARRPVDWHESVREARWIAMFPRLVLLAREDFCENSKEIFVIREHRTVGEPFDPEVAVNDSSRPDMLVVASALLGLPPDTDE